MPTPTIPDGELFFNATLYTGNGSTQTIVNGAAGQSFQPDFVWIKGRSDSWGSALTDVVRGVTSRLTTNNTNAEFITATGVTSLNSNGFSLSTNGDVNNLNDTYVAWNWKAGGAAVTNTAGTISSQVSANTTSGFSVVTYTGTGTNATVGHGLGVAPSMIIVKARNVGTQDWQVYHVTLGVNQAIQLNQTSAASSATNYWYNGVTSTVFGVNGSYPGVNGNTNTYVAYCWAPIAGYSAFGSYTGNGSTDGTFVYTGFRPKFVMLKSSSNISNWIMMDTSTNPNNVMSNYLRANASDAEASTSSIDAVSNGFKLRTTDTSWNSSGGTFIYMAFAENPFKYANAR
jgi:hypothetical protein